MKQALKEVAYRALAASGAYRLIAPAYRGRGVVLGLHRIRSGPSRWLAGENRLLETDLDFFSAVLDYFETRCFEFIALGEVAARLETKGQKPFVVVTFDDGYHDVASLAYPLLKARNIPFTVYVTTGFADGTSIAWWYVREKLGEEAQSLAPLFFHGDPNEALARVRAMAKGRDIDAAEITASEALSWKQIRELARDPLVTIGSHAVTHLPLSRLSAQDVAREFSASKQRLETELGTCVSHFSYPFGTGDTVGSREQSECARAGFQTAVTTNGGNLFSEHRQNIYALPRLMLGGDESMRSFRQRHAGLPFIRTGPWRPGPRH